MNVHVQCQGCQTNLNIPAVHAGKRGKCPKCGDRILIPMPQDASEAHSGEHEDAIPHPFSLDFTNAVSPSANPDGADNSNTDSHLPEADALSDPISGFSEEDIDEFFAPVDFSHVPLAEIADAPKPQNPVQPSASEAQPTEDLPARLGTTDLDGGDAPQSEGSMFFATCPGCGASDVYAVCLNCKHFDRFTGNEDSIECECGMPVPDSIGCPYCGALIFRKKLAPDPAMQEACRNELPGDGKARPSAESVLREMRTKHPTLTYVLTFAALLGIIHYVLVPLLAFGPGGVPGLGSIWKTPEKTVRSFMKTWLESPSSASALLDARGFGGTSRTLELYDIQSWDGRITNMGDEALVSRTTGASYPVTTYLVSPACEMGGSYLPVDFLIGVAKDTKMVIALLPR